MTLLVLIAIAPSAMAIFDPSGTPYDHQHSWELLNIDYTGCTSPAYYVYACSLCGQQKVEEKAGPGHDYKLTFTQPATCTDSGYASYTCSRCGDVTREVLPALGHDWGDWQTDEPATCNQNGTEKRVCRRCGETVYRSVSGGEHEWGDWKVEIPGDCVTIELRYRKCKRCGETKYQNWGYGDHKWGDWVVFQSPDCTHTGIMRQYCLLDSTHMNEAEIPVDPDAHDWGEWEVEIPATETSVGYERRVCKINPEHVERRELAYVGPTLAPFIPEPDLLITGNYSGGPFQEGDTFSVDLTIYNLGNVPLQLDSFEASDRDHSGDPLKDLPKELEANSSLTVTVTVTVTADDIAAAVPDPETGLFSMERFWIVHYNYIDDTAIQSISDSWLIAPYLIIPDNTKGGGLNAALRMTVSAPDPNNAFYLKDDVVTFDVTLTNVGSVDLTDCQVLVQDGDGNTYTLDYGALSPSESKTIAWSVAIGDVHVGMGRDLIEFRGHGWVPTEVLNGDAAVSGHTDGLVTAEPLERDLKVMEAPPSPEDYALFLEVTPLTAQAAYNLDDPFNYEAKVINTSSDTLYDVVINMTFDSVGEESHYISDLAPSESASYVFYNHVIQEDLVYAAEHGGQVGLHWVAVGRSDAGEQVFSNECVDYIAIDPSIEEQKPEITITSITEGSGAGKQVGDYVSVHLTVENTGNTKWKFTGVWIDGTGDAHYDFSDEDNYTYKEFEPGESFGFDIGIEIRDTDAASDVKAVIRDFTAYADYGEIGSNTVSCNIPLDDIPIPPPVVAPGAPDLVLNVVCPDAEPFFFDGEGKTGDVHYQAVVCNVGDAPCYVTGIRITTAAGARTEPVGPFLLYPAEATPDLPLTNDFSETEIDTDGRLHITFAAEGEEDGKAYESGPVELSHEVSQDPPPWIPPTETQLIVEKHVVSTETTSEGYLKDDVVDYEIWVYNDSDIIIPSIDLEDPLFGGTVGTISNLAAHGWSCITCSYTVTQTDVDNKKIENTATARWTDPETGVDKSESSNTVIVFTTEPKEAGVWIDITFEKEPANGSFYVEGETFPIRVDWKNTSKEMLYHVYAYDAMADWMGYGLLVDDGTLAPDEAGTFTFDYVVDDIDVDIFNAVYDDASIWGYDQYDVIYIAYDMETRPADRPVPAPDTKTPGLKVEKKETSTPADGRAYYIEGETITYEITVTNTGNVDLSNVTVADSLSDTFMGAFATIPMLHPNEARKYPYNYKVTQPDVDAKKVVNYAIGYYSYDTLLDVPVFSEPVESPTGPQKGPTPTHHDPDGHIDTPIVKSGKDDACVMTLVARGDGTAEYELHLCAKHAAIYDKAQSLGSAAAWQQAANEWKNALEEIYQQILRASAGSARTAVMEERAVFFAYVDSIKAVMNQQNPRSAVLAEQTAAEMLMRQCAELCYVVHYAPEDRPDSLFTGNYRITCFSGSSPKCAESEAKHGSDLTIRRFLCADHAKIDAGALALVRQARTRASAAEAFKRARRSWQAELNNLVSAQYSAAPKENRKLISSCRQLFDSLLEKREALYSFIYADRPEVVQEVLTRTVLEDIIRRCK